jgi:hypothetical protein
VPRNPIKELRSMYPLKAVVPLAVAIGVTSASPAVAKTVVAKHHAAGAPVARAAGGDAGPPIYPGLVNSRLVRTQRALDRATDYADDGNTDKARSALYVARLNVKLAWRAAKRVIQTAPPPVVGDGLAGRRIRVRRSRVRARLSGSGGGGFAVADQYTTAGGVLAMQHIVAQTAIGMIDMAHGTFRDSLSRTIFVALDQRDGAVSYIHSIDTPPPPGDGLTGRASRAPVAHASGGAVGGSWSTTMSPIAGLVDDEVNQIDGVLALSQTLGAGIKRVLKDAEFQDIQTQRTINQYWPPVVGD